MLAKNEERKHDLRNTTVMEVIIAIIIVLLCVILFKDNNIKDFIKNEDLLNQQVKDLKEENQKLRSEVLELKNILRDKNAEIELLQNRLERRNPKKPGEPDEDENKDEIIYNLEKENILLKNKIIELNDIIKELQIEITLLKAQVENFGIDRSKDDLLKRIKELEAELQKLKNKYGDDGKGGIDKPSCEKDANGKIISIGTLKKSGSDVIFKINPNVSTSFKELSFVQDLTRTYKYSFSYFLSKSKQIRRFADDQKTPCVYFLTINQVEWSGSDLQKIENYFYKINSR